MRHASGLAIKGFRHKGLEWFFLTGSRSGIQAKHGDRLRLFLGRLNISTSARDMNLPGLDIHELSWRVTFSWTGKDVERVDYEDYH